MGQVDPSFGRFSSIFSKAEGGAMESVVDSERVHGSIPVLTRVGWARRTMRERTPLRLSNYRRTPCLTEAR